jgi:hypothetical protein
VGQLQGGSALAMPAPSPITPGEPKPPARTTPATNFFRSRSEMALITCSSSDARSLGWAALTLSPNLLRGSMICALCAG